MSTEDKTGDKLVASIRKTKASAAGADPATTGNAAAPQAAEKPAPRRRAAPKAKAKPKAPAGGSSKRTGGDSYQSSGRIWPD